MTDTPVNFWKSHPHDAGFNFDNPEPERWHEYGCDLGKYHTPAILFYTREECDKAFDQLSASVNSSDGLGKPIDEASIRADERARVADYIDRRAHRQARDVRLELMSVARWLRSILKDNVDSHDELQALKDEMALSLEATFVAQEARDAALKRVAKLEKLLARCVKYALEDRMRTPGKTRLARALGEAERLLGVPNPRDEYGRVPRGT